MTTTNSNLMAGKASAGSGRDGKRGRFGLRATLAAGMATLGCAAALLLGGLGAEHAARVQPQPVPAAVQRPAGTDDLDTNRCIGTVGPFACASAAPAAPDDEGGASTDATVPFTGGWEGTPASWCAQVGRAFACAPAVGHLADEYLER